ncbi:ketoacyl-ACP synthase III [Pseudomaricurvus alkylphenolicus]|uniref:ketoacyl-ACP synthase III n=1 Tax=Pseudomaricurvus alkylphenolicus TaxID=1306991 RepID=UPI00141E2A08|nr:ketoacyl-ACP synthase III [Pseudomaricurvus alkylphenolicus]NIB40791.1 ketoacyl-ACP synthase III [Pseudomaricurvus alkylphenolicus]
MDFRTHSRIAGIGAYLPSQKVSSIDLMTEIKSRRFGVPENFISRYIGIIERRFSEDALQPSDMAYRASIGAIEESGIDPTHIDWIIFCGIDRDWKEPATACRVQQLLGASNAACLDISNACLGFMNGLALADAYITSGMADNVLVCTGEKQSEMVLEMMGHIQRSNEKAFFKTHVGALTVGDAGGAMVIQRSDGRSGFGQFRFWSQGEKNQLCYLKQTSQGMVGQMMMGAISEEVIKLHGEHIDQTYRDIGWNPANINSFVCHQVGRDPHKKLALAAHTQEEKAPITYSHMGNLTSATIPVNMYINRPCRGDKVLFLGSGSGISICQTGMTY